jgi:hypothetical protein
MDASWAFQIATAFPAASLTTSNSPLTGSSEMVVTTPVHAGCAAARGTFDSSNATRHPPTSQEKRRRRGRWQRAGVAEIMRSFLE